MNKLCILLISEILVSTSIFQMLLIPSIQAQGITSDLPMTTINESSTSNNTADDATDTHNMSSYLLGDRQ